MACLGKEGACPALQQNVVGICVQVCNTDFDCPDVQKCCGNGCGKVCMKPTQIRTPTGLC
ncbi:hypothetical protein DPMN_001942 [Dreissena polymorpha]|uniref:WAP domain-containing protein n=2 Tax=Dreissena polymorpha TaxID=45954 RepID=A0A9D4MKQ5_DREPO|nr:hypothetical protein DPMN_001942 [Dreissena polymorpha]